MKIETIDVLGVVDPEQPVTEPALREQPRVIARPVLNGASWVTLAEVINGQRNDRSPLAGLAPATPSEHTVPTPEA